MWICISSSLIKGPRAGGTGKRRLGPGGSLSSGAQGIGEETLSCGVGGPNFTPELLDPVRCKGNRNASSKLVSYMLPLVQLK